MNILRDCTFENGFDLTHTDGLVTRDAVKHLNYCGRAKNKADWKIAQWCSKYNLANGQELVSESGNYLYRDVSKCIKVFPGRKRVSLELNASEEYPRPRKDGEGWAHILLEQSFSENACSIAKLKSLSMDLDFAITRYTNYMNEGECTDIHTAQFQWFLSIADKNKKSKGYDDFFWFGISYFDFPRYDFPPEFTAQDGGKEENTGKFINIISAKDILLEPVKIGKAYSYKTEVLKHITKGFALAKERGFLKNSSFDDMVISSMNIGFEVTGTFDVSATIEKIAIDAMDK